MRAKSIFLLLAALLIANAASAVSITSSDGYTVNVNVTPTALVKSTTTNCGNNMGYQYTIDFTYTISFSGTNIPASLYYAAGNFTCGSNILYFSLGTGAGPGSGTSSNTSTGASDCATSTLSSLQCLTNYELTIQGPGIGTNGSITLTVPFNNTPLPVTLKSFDARMQGKDVFLAWTAASELRNSSFHVERSTDARQWEAISTISAAGDQQYQYTDSQPAAGMNYYRLRQADNDGSAIYSGTIGVNIPEGDDLSIYPNPARDSRLHVKGLESPSQWTLSVTSATSQQMFSAALFNADITLPALPAGLYFIRLTNSASHQSKTFKFICE